ncbi:MAG TPA: hypothetical protein VEL76_34010, partial [Gemmataceae bacterium]|nr:hypothetical protein [Gemmataceae bacterium]
MSRTPCGIPGKAAVQQLARYPAMLAKIDAKAEKDTTRRIGLLLAHRASGKPTGTQLVPAFLADRDEGVRFQAVKWIADERLTQFRPLLVAALKDRTLTVHMYQAFSTALARVENREVSEASMADSFLDRLSDPQTSPAVRVMALRMVPPTHKRLKLATLTDLLARDEIEVQLEAVRSLNEHPSPQRTDVLLKVVRDNRYLDSIRAEALVGVAEGAAKVTDELMQLARGDKPLLRDEALRAL